MMTEDPKYFERLRDNMVTAFQRAFQPPDRDNERIISDTMLLCYLMEREACAREDTGPLHFMGLSEFLDSMGPVTIKSTFRMPPGDDCATVPPTTMDIGDFRSRR